MFIAFPPLQLLHERASMLRYTYSTLPVRLFVYNYVNKILCPYLMASISVHPIIVR
jgi:hypothetical protein